jgi:hypothetical protein
MRFPPLVEITKPLNLMTLGLGESGSTASNQNPVQCQAVFLWLVYTKTAQTPTKPQKIKIKE